MKKSSVVIAALREWLRMEANPRIVFVTTVTGERRSAISAGPQVWTIAEAWQQLPVRKRSTTEVAETLGLSESDVEAALSYWAEYRNEIDPLIEQHQRDQDDALAAWERRRALHAV